jgi:hypothetical protein
LERLTKKPLRQYACCPKPHLNHINWRYSTSKNDQHGLINLSIYQTLPFHAPSYDDSAWPAGKSPRDPLSLPYFAHPCLLESFLLKFPSIPETFETREVFTYMCIYCATRNDTPTETTTDDWISAIASAFACIAAFI